MGKRDCEREQRQGPGHHVLRRDPYSCGQVLRRGGEGDFRFGFLGPLLHDGEISFAEVLDLPLGSRAATATQLVNEFYNKFKPKELDGEGHVSPCPWSRNPSYQETGQDTRGSERHEDPCTGTTAKIAAALGATPVAMPMSDTYDAISRGSPKGSWPPWKPFKAGNSERSSSIRLKTMALLIIWLLCRDE